MNIVLRHPSAEKMGWPEAMYLISMVTAAVLLMFCMWSGWSSVIVLMIFIVLV